MKVVKMKAQILKHNGISFVTMDFPSCKKARKLFKKNRYVYYKDINNVRVFAGDRKSANYLFYK